jgi:DNA-binding GntR family transcriptional regulator
VRSRPIFEQIADRLRDAIRDGQFQPGEHLVEGNLCALTGASRPSVREALRKLETQGLVENNGRQGLRVTITSQDEAQQIYAVRSALEGLAARLFARTASQEQRDALAVSVGEIEAAGDDVAALLVAKRHFYEAFLLGAGNTYVDEMLSLVRARIWPMRAKSLTKPGRPAESLREVQALLAAVQVGDEAAAEQAMMVHIRNAAQALHDQEMAEAVVPTIPAAPAANLRL